MRLDARIMVIGPPALGSAVAHALPRSRSMSAAGLLSGLWAVGQQEFDGVVVSLGNERSALRAMTSQCAPAPRISPRSLPAQNQSRSSKRKRFTKCRSTCPT